MQMFYFSAYIRFFATVLNETNVNISNEANFSDVYRSVNYTLHFHGPLLGPFTLHATQCSLYFDKPQKNGIHSLIIIPHKNCISQFS